MSLKIIAVSAFSVFMTAAAFAIQSSEEELHRGDYIQLVADKNKQLISTPQNANLRWDVAQEEFSLGNLEQAEKNFKQLLSEPDYAKEALYFIATIHYLRGEYTLAENIFSDLLQQDQKNFKSKTGLLYVYYQTNQYSKAKSLFENETDVHFLSEHEHALHALMQSFGDEKPFNIEWKAKKAVIPFISMNSLPVVSVKVNGQLINVFIDTGGDLFILDTKIAEKLGLKPIASYTGLYAGGKTAQTSYSRLQTLDLGDVILHSLPVDLAEFPDTWKFTDENNGEPIVVAGILSTSVFRQFLTTLDYPERKLILSPRKGTVSKIPDQNLANIEQGEKVPFIMDGTHFMIAKGAINGKEGMTFFLDSGLDDPEAAVLLQKGAIDYANVKLENSETVLIDDDSKGGLGGGGFEVTRLDLDNVSLGGLKQTGVIGLFGVLPPVLFYTESGMILDGFISHQFLRHYKWTIDFDEMLMTFNQ